VVQLPDRRQVEVVPLGQLGVEGIVFAKQREMQQRVRIVLVELRAADVAPLQRYVDLPRRLPGQPQVVSPGRVDRLADRAVEASAVIRARARQRRLLWLL